MYMVELKNVSMKFKMPTDNIRSLKEFAIKMLKRKLNYKMFSALDDISFCIKSGEVVGIIGANGAGKSTLLKIVSGILQPTTGSIHIGGNVAPMLELGAGFDYDLTARENIFLNGAILGYTKKYLTDRFTDIVDFAELHDFLDMPIRNFSSGMVMRLAFSIATLVNPDILIIDEILSVGDSYFQEKSALRMRSLINSGVTVLMVSHSIDQVRELCHRVVWIENHSIKIDGVAKDVCDAYEKQYQGF